MSNLYVYERSEIELLYYIRESLKTFIFFILSAAMPQEFSSRHLFYKIKLYFLEYNNIRNQDLYVVRKAKHSLAHDLCNENPKK